MAAVNKAVMGLRGKRHPHAVVQLRQDARDGVPLIRIQALFITAT